MGKDLKPIFIWSKSIGDANIYDRIIMKALPTLIQYDVKLTSDSIEDQEQIIVPNDLYEIIKEIAQTLLQQPYKMED